MYQTEKTKIIVADDIFFIRRTIANLLTSNGLEVVGEASNGKEAVEMYKRFKPDIITMDMTMSEKCGIEAVKEIKKFDSNANIIMISSMAQELMVKQALTNGVKGFILKPFTDENLIKTIKKLM